MPIAAIPQSLFLYSTTVSDVGTVRTNNQDSSFAGEHLIAICDGMGGHAGGDTASTIAIRSLAHIEHGEALNNVETIAGMMENSVLAAHDAIVGKAKREHALAGMGTTVTAIALASGYWVLTHIGDSRAYLLRDGKLIRMTSDHSYVQHLIDTGRISEVEARNHPQRNVVMRVLGDFDIDPHPDIAIRAAHSSDRWLLCSDGLCGVLEDSTIEESLSTISDQKECAQQLVSMALKAGSTDNVTAVIADATLALDENSFDVPHQTPVIGGAANANLEAIADIVNEPVASAPPLLYGKGSPAQRAAALTQEGEDSETQVAATPRVAQPSTIREEIGDRVNLDTGEIPIVKKQNGQVTADPNDPEVANAIHNEQKQQRQASRTRRRWKRVGVVTALVLVIAALITGAFSAYRWSQSKYFLGNANGVVTIYQGVPTNVFGISLSHEVKRTDIRISSLPQSWRDQLAQGITVDTFSEAQSHADLIKRESQSLTNGGSTTNRPSSSPSSSSSSPASSSSSPSPSASKSQTTNGATP